MSHRNAINSKQNRILIRADASTQIGTGHVMRCLALAQAVRNEGIPLSFVVADLPHGLIERFNAERILWHKLQTTSGSQDDATQIITFAHQSKADWIVVDGYQFGLKYQQALKQSGLQLLMVDDYGHAEQYVADLVLNQNIYANASLYPNRDPDTQLLLGSNYVLLRQEFLQWRKWQRNIQPMATNILVTMGGSDPENQSLKVIQALQQITDSDLSAIVVVGAGNPHLPLLADAVGGSDNIRLFQNVSDMPNLIAWADIAISAGGSTCWELAFMGVPSILFVLADNQSGIAIGLEDAGVAINLGRVETVSSSQISDALLALVYDVEQRHRMSEQGRQLVDGGGALRVIDQIRRRTHGSA